MSGLFKRFRENPLISPQDVRSSRDDMEVLSVFNPGAVELGEEIILLLRVAERPIPEKGQIATAALDFSGGQAQIRTLRFDLDDPDVRCDDPRVFHHNGTSWLTSISHVRLARSRDGLHFTVDDRPAIYPAEPYEQYGIEDARVVRMGHTYWINASAISATGISTALYSTRDFKRFERHGVIFCPDNKDVAIFPETIGGQYVAFHRPASAWTRPSIWLAHSPDLLSWGGHRFVAGVRADGWDNGRVGCGASPIKTPKGWLAIYHGATPNDHYSLGAMLLDLNDPSVVLARSRDPLLWPEAPYETNGLLHNVVFTNGQITRDGVIRIYYGAADRCVAGAETTVEAVLDSLSGEAGHSGMRVAGAADLSSDCNPATVTAMQL